MNSRGLLELSVREFVGAVASADQPTPAGGSVAALTGASSAALLALVCGVTERKSPGGLAQPLERARALQQRLLELVEQDAAAFRAFLDAPRSSPARQAAAERVAAMPLRIGGACLEVRALVAAIEPNVSGALQLDVGAARQLAQAAARSALDIAEHNLALVADPGVKERLGAEITALRERRA